MTTNQEYRNAFLQLRDGLNGLQKLITIYYDATGRLDQDPFPTKPMTLLDAVEAYNKVEALPEEEYSGIKLLADDFYREILCPVKERSG